MRKVASRSSQHSKMLGQPASWQTVCRPSVFDQRTQLGVLRAHLRRGPDPLRLALDRRLGVARLDAQHPATLRCDAHESSLAMCGTAGDARVWSPGQGSRLRRGPVPPRAPTPPARGAAQPAGAPDGTAPRPAAGSGGQRTSRRRKTRAATRTSATRARRGTSRCARTTASAGRSRSCSRRRSSAPVDVVGRPCWSQPVRLIAQQPRLGRAAGCCRGCPRRRWPTQRQRRGRRRCAAAGCRSPRPATGDHRDEEDGAPTDHGDAGPGAGGRPTCCHGRWANDPTPRAVDRGQGQHRERDDTGARGQSLLP